MARVICTEANGSSLYARLKTEFAAEMENEKPDPEIAAFKAIACIMAQLHGSTQQFALTEDEFYDKAVDVARDWTSKDTANRIIVRVCKLLKSSGLQFKP